MNCGNIKCGYQCVQKDQMIEKEKTNQLVAITTTIRDFAKPGTDKQVQYKALQILELILKKEELI